MKKIFTVALAGRVTMLNAQKPPREQIEKDKKAFAEVQRKLNETLSRMIQEARRQYNSMMNAFGAEQKINSSIQQVDYCRFQRLI